MALAESQENSLPLWAEFVTRDLCAEAQKRVVQEVRAHFADLIEGMVQRGMSHEDACGVALAQLGSAKDARKAYRRVYLTKSDEEFLMRNLSPRCKQGARVAKWVSRFVIIVSMCAALFLEGLATHRPMEFPIIVVNVVMLAWSIGFWCELRVRGFSDQGRVSLALLNYCIAESVYWLVWNALEISVLVMIPYSIRIAWSNLTLVLACVYVVGVADSVIGSVWRYQRLSRKMSRSCANPDEGAC